MKRILITGGTTFVSRFTARWFVQRGYEVHVLNRGNKPQEEGVHLLRADRHAIPQEMLKGTHFHAVLDITAYTGEDVASMLDALGSFDDYLLISSSAVYPEHTPPPFDEESPVGKNAFWGQYGLDKIEAETVLFSRVPEAYAIRPPYLYGPMQNIYREPIVFDCAMQDRPFCLPQDGEMQLQFFHVEDLCRVMEAILLRHPAWHVLNVGNPETVSIRQWAEMCYAAVGKKPQFIPVHADLPQRSYCCWHDYEYKLDVSRQSTLLSNVVPLQQGIAQEWAWYRAHPDDVTNKRDYLSAVQAIAKPDRV